MYLELKECILINCSQVTNKCDFYLVNFYSNPYQNLAFAFLFISEVMEVVAPFGNFFRSLKLKTRLELGDEKWVYTEEPHVERRKVSYHLIFTQLVCTKLI